MNRLKKKLFSGGPNQDRHRNGDDETLNPYRTIVVLVRYAIGLFLFFRHRPSSAISDFQGLIASLWSATDHCQNGSDGACNVNQSQPLRVSIRIGGGGGGGLRYEAKARQHSRKVVHDAPAEQQQ